MVTLFNLFNLTSHEELIPNVYFGFIYPYFSLAPIVNREFSAVAAQETITDIGDNLEDILFMIDPSESGNGFDLVFDRLLLSCLSIVEDSESQISALNCLRKISLSHSESSIFIKILIPLLLDTFSNLHDDGKILAMDLFLEHLCGQSRDIRVYCASRLVEKMKSDIAVRVHIKANSLLTTLLDDFGEVDNISVKLLLDDIYTFRKVTKSISRATLFDPITSRCEDLIPLINHTFNVTELRYLIILFIISIISGHIFEC